MKTTRQIQEALNAAGYNVGVADGIAGQKLVNGLAAFQRDQGLTADGRFGPNTERALFGGNAPVAAEPATESETPTRQDADATGGVSPSLHCFEENVFKRQLNQGQIDGCAAIVNEYRRRQLTDKRFLAYMLATAYHETGATMQPVHERGGPAYFTKMYDVTGQRPDTARKMGNTQPGDGPRYCGRGYVQLTWKTNYAVMTTKLREAGMDVDLVANPDLAMNVEVSTFVMFNGMLNGVFTGRRLSSYFNGPNADWVNARKIINGLDCAEKIAGYGRGFNACL